VEVFDVVIVNEVVPVAVLYSDADGSGELDS
jgi:hypothetical protein